MDNTKIKKDVPLHAGHRKRMKERFLEAGLDSFAPHEILEMLLFYSIPQKNTNEIGHRLIKCFGDLQGVFSAPISELTKIEGISENSATHIKFISALFQQIAKRRLSESIVGKTATLEEVGESLTHLFFCAEVETVYLLLFDGEMRIIDCVLLHEGDNCSARISERKIASYVLKNENTQNIILAHNHIHSSPLPSVEDIQSTHQLKNWIAKMGAYLAEHFVISGGKYHPILNTVGGIRSAADVVIDEATEESAVYF
ncbi:MAG: RadC family protein [Clostridia bacterium]|nr:RadC family protein [Clostridia bacterium]